jgi:hypothetical protein
MSSNLLLKYLYAASCSYVLAELPASCLCTACFSSAALTCKQCEAQHCVRAAKCSMPEVAARSRPSASFGHNQTSSLRCARG